MQSGFRLIFLNHVKVGQNYQVDIPFEIVQIFEQVFQFQTLLHCESDLQRGVNGFVPHIFEIELFFVVLQVREFKQVDVYMSFVLMLADQVDVHILVGLGVVENQRDFLAQIAFLNLLFQCQSKQVVVMVGNQFFNFDLQLPDVGGDHFVFF